MQLALSSHSWPSPTFSLVSPDGLGVKFFEQCNYENHFLLHVEFLLSLGRFEFFRTIEPEIETQPVPRWGDSLFSSTSS